MWAQENASHIARSMNVFPRSMSTAQLSTVPNLARTCSFPVQTCIIGSIVFQYPFSAVRTSLALLQFTSLFHIDYIKLTILEFGAHLAPTSKTIEYIAIDSLLTVILVLYMLLNNSATSV